MSKRAQTRNHLIFYIGAIVLVVGLFEVTTSYGEANLKAPPNINGRYLTATAPPGCPDASRLAISIQQSGIYLNGGLELVDQASAKPKTHAIEHSLSGRWQQQITLNGRTKALASCEANLANVDTNLQGTVAGTPAASLVGQLTFAAQPWSFTAQRQPEEAKEEAH
jgi:hypothetical protein